MYDCLDLDFKFFTGDYWSFVWKIVVRHMEKIREVIPVHYFITHLNDTFPKGHFIYKKDLESEITFYLKEELKRQKASTWDYATFPGYETYVDEIQYKIIQLDNPRLLTDEGSVMKHCVRTYEYNCKIGRCSIWSLRSWAKNGKEKRHVTIEVNEQ